MASSTTTNKLPDGSVSGHLASPTGSRHRRDSINSVSASSVVDRDLAQALDKIHTSASRCETLTTFNDFAPPPVAAPTSESRTTAGDFVHQGLSGLYSRFREAVGAASPAKSAIKEEDVEHLDSLPKRASVPEAHVSKASISSLNRPDTGGSISTTTHTALTTDTSSPAVSTGASETRPQMPGKSTSISLMGGQKSFSSSRQSLPTNATSSVTADPTIAAPHSRMHRDPSRSTIRTDDSGGQDSNRRSTSRADLHAHLSPIESSGLYDLQDAKMPLRIKRDDNSSLDGSIDASSLSPSKAKSPLISPVQTHHVRSLSGGSSLLSPDDARRKPAVIDRITQTNPPRHSGSRDSSVDRGTAEANHINTSAHNSIHHDSFSQDSNPQQLRSGDVRIPGTISSHQGASDQMNAQLDRMRRQVLSKEFWMKDDTVKECFLCQTPFTAFRRKHHCRTCGFIFDSKCTTVVSGERFGVSSSLRVCKRCLDVITRRFDASASEDSGDEQSFMPRFFGGDHSKKSSATREQQIKEVDFVGGSEGSEDARPVSTPMMAIAATRRVRDSNHSSSVLEIDAPQLSRPGSSRSLKSLTSGRPHSSAGHKRHHSKHALLGRFKPPGQDDYAPFRQDILEQNARKPKYPAFHDDNIIDPELADYMSEDSSGDEHVSIFATMASSDLQPASFEGDKANLASLMNAARKHRHRGGEKSISGMSHFSRGIDDMSGPPSFAGHRRSTRRRNISNVSGSVHHMSSPRPKSALYKGPSVSTEMLFTIESQAPSGTQLIRSDSLQKKAISKAELNGSSLRHVDKLLHQLLVDAKVPNPEAWQKALVPILVQSTDDVAPDVANGESMDIRNYVKLKRIPGGKPGDTSYVSGVVFTKNLALKSMPRKIKNPRILLVGFPIEYQRHQQQFMSLQPVIEQEKEFLGVVVRRITNLRPHVLLAEKSISGVALQYLSEANISVAYNVKRSVIAAVARCTETSIIESLDMLTAQVGRCSAFEVRTFVNNDYPGRKKSYIFLSGCRPDLGCTINLRGASNPVLAKVKHIVDFMVYVVYNLKLESSLLRDESIEPPEVGDSSLSNSCHALNESFQSISSTSATESGRNGPTVVLNQPSSESEPPSQLTRDSSSLSGTDEASSIHQSDQPAQERPKLVSLHETHAHVSHDSQVPDDVPMPTFYSDMVAKYETKILSASPYVKFTQPYLLMKAREQERRLLYLRRLRDHDTIEEQDDLEKQERQKFQLITPEMVDEIGKKAPRQIMEILHAVHDAEYDKALFNYQTQTRQWETYIQGNLDLFDPYSHQNIVVLYSVICTETKIPCTEPSLVAINFYDEQREETGMDPDCTLGQYIEHLTFSKDDVCESNGCERKMLEHHRTFVHDQSRITVFVEHNPNAAQRPLELGEGITMWTYCKICKKDSEETAMSETTFKYSFGKYLELLYWGRGLRMKHSVECPHDHHRDHVRYFSLGDSRIRIHWDPIDLLEIVVPRPRITWKVANDLKLKNEIFTKMEERWYKFMASVGARLKSIRIDSVLPEKAESCRVELEQLTKKAQEEQATIARRLQHIYVNSKYYEVVPFNSMVREMLEKAGEWDQVFAKFEADFLGDKDMRQLTMIQLKKMFTDDESKESLVSNEGTGSVADSDERPSQTFSEADERSTQPTEYTDNSMEASATSSKPVEDQHPIDEDGKVHIPADGAIERVESLDLASSPTSTAIKSPPQQSPNETPLSSSSPQSLPPLSPTLGNRATTDPILSGQTLTEKVDRMRREHGLLSGQIGSEEPDGSPASVETPRPIPDRAPVRKSGSTTSPPIIRAISHPVRALPRPIVAGKEPAGKIAEGLQSEPQLEGTIKVDKKLSDRLGLTSLKNRGKMSGSSIPRLVHKKRETKVSTLARHFEQLSREFEKERIRDRKKRAANQRPPRPMLPKSSTMAIIQVYDDVNEAFDEPAAVNEQELDRDNEQRSTTAATSQADDASRTEVQTEPQTPIEPSSQSEDQSRWDDETTNVNTSQGASGDEGNASDGEPSVSDEFMPDIKEIADSSSEIPLELPRHQKTSLMKYLTNFWAERSASGWPPLEYPVNASDHIFVDSDIIVREDEPSSVIALALNSDDYQGKLGNIRREAQEVMMREGEATGDVGEPRSVPASERSDWFVDETDLEKSLLRFTGTHLKYQFREGAAVMTCKIFYAEQFDALRRKCGVGERIVESLSRCLKWDSKGGKTKSVFLKTLDDRLVLKVR